jgi:hypothetical protein
VERTLNWPPRSHGIEALAKIDPLEGRRQIRLAIERDYTSPVAGPLPVPGAQ